MSLGSPIGSGGRSEGSDLDWPRAAPRSPTSSERSRRRSRSAAGGIKSLGGANIELLLADSQTKTEVARAEADRLLNAGAQLLTGAFHSAHVASIASVAQQRRVPYIIDISAADAPTANVAKSVREGQQKVQYVYRIFPGSVTFGRNAARYMSEIFREAGVSQLPRSAQGAGFEIVEVITGFSYWLAKMLRRFSVGRRSVTAAEADARLEQFDLLVGRRTGSRLESD